MTATVGYKPEVQRIGVSLVLMFVVLFGGGLEEPSWRGYLLPALQETYIPLTAGLLVGVVRAGWQVLLVFDRADTMRRVLDLDFVVSLVFRSTSSGSLDR